MVFLPSVSNAMMPKLHIKFTHLYSFKIGTFQVYWRSEARLQKGTASLAGNLMLFWKSRAKFALIVGSLVLAASLPAQTVSSIQIYTNPPGPLFQVDGQIYSQPVTLLWPQGSKHVILVNSPQTVGQIPTQYSLQTVTSNIGPIRDLSNITADPSLTYIELPFATNYGVDLNYFVCGTAANCNNICP